MKKLDHALRENAGKIGAVQIPIVDWKANEALERYTPALECVAKVREDYRQHNFATGDKVTTNVVLAQDDVSSHLNLLLKQTPHSNEHTDTGSSSNGFFYQLSLPLPSPHGRKKREASSLKEALERVAKPTPGGNVSNMIRNYSHFLRAGMGPEIIKLFSPQEPFFNNWINTLPTKVRERIEWQEIDINPRTGIHLPYPKESSNEIGTLALVSPSHSTLEKIQPHIESLANCNHVIVSEGIGSLVTGSTELRQKLVQLLNPSGGWRPQCALDAWMLREPQDGRRGRSSIVTMNGEEMDEFIRHMLAPSTETDFSEIPQLPFASPFFAQGLDLNVAGINSANIGFSKYFQCLPNESHSFLTFPTSISLGSEGGYHVAIVNDKKYICFASTPDKRGAVEMINMLGNQTKISLKKERTMGAGDAVATILSLAHTWDLEKMIKSFADPQDPLNDKFIHVASIIFVSLLSRVVGEYVFHSDRCDITDIPISKMRPLISTTAEIALRQSRKIWNATKKTRAESVGEWGIRLAFWELREE